MSVSWNPDARPSPQEIWNQTIQKHRQRLQRHNVSIKELEYGAFQLELENKDREYGKSKVVRSVQTIAPTLAHLHTFSMAISNVAQGQANPCSFIWGTLLVLFICVGHFSATLDSITSMLKDLTLTMVVFNRYIELCLDNATLQGYLVLLYDDYVSFCVTVILFYKKRPWSALLAMFSQKIVQSFEASKASIRQHVKAFERETRVNVDELTVTGLTELRARLPQQVPSGDDELIWEVPFSQNGFFFGRDNELEELHQKLVSSIPPSSLRSCVVHSMSGMGKTQLALEYAYRFRTHFDCVFWLGADRGPELAQNLADIAEILVARRRLDPHIIHSMGQSRVTREVMRWLERTRELTGPIITFWADKEINKYVGEKWLLIYDNAEDWNIIAPYWPHTTHGSIILTSQRSQIRYITASSEIALQAMEPTDGAGLLFKYLPRISRNEVPISDMVEARAISQTLGGLPIAIAHCAGWIDKTQSSLPEFSKIYERREGSQQIWANDLLNTTYQYNKKLDTLWDIALHELPPDAISVVNLMSMLNPERIPEVLLLETLEGSQRQIPFVIMNLRDRQLVSRNVLSSGVSYNIHRALQRNLLHKLDQDPPHRQRVFEQALEIVRKGFPRQSAIQAPTNDNWSANDSFLPHVLALQSCFENSDPPINASMEFAKLLSDVGNHLWERGLYSQGKKTLELAETACESLCSNSFEDVIEKTKLYVNLGGLSLDLGISGRAKGLEYFVKILILRRRYIEARQDASEEDYILLANAWNDIACVLNECQDYVQAGTCLEMSLKVKKQHLITEDGLAFFNYAENYKNLAWVRVAEGDSEAAVKLARLALKLMVDHIGSDCASTEAFRFHLAVILSNTNHFDEALELHLLVKKHRTRILGSTGTHTLHSSYACAMAYKALRRNQKAIECINECLAAADEIEWPQECVARTKYQLGVILLDDANEIQRATGLIQAARELLAKLDPGQKLMQEDSWQKYGLDFEATVFDHLVSFEAGRYIMGQLVPFPLNLEACADGDVVLSAE